MKIILGSSSPRRKEILNGVVNCFDIIRPEADETILPGETPDRYARRVSEDKARSVIEQAGADQPALIITCDTIVTINNTVIGKPEDREDAVRIITGLSGKTHRVISAVSMTVTGSGLPITTGSETSHVLFKRLNRDGIEAYLKRVHYMDKAGAYAVQEHGDMIIERIGGSVTNVIGFPLRLFFRMIREMDVAETVLFQDDTDIPVKSPG